jgi:protein-disulfide isomerase
LRDLIRYFVGGIRGLALLASLVMGVMMAPLAVAADEAAKPDAENTGVYTGEIVLGEADAPVTIIEFSSMTCPHCADFHINVLPALKEKYIDAGKVKLIMREFPLDGLALRVSMLARCSGESKVKGFISIFFEQQNIWAASENPIEELARITRLGGMNQQRFDACLANESLMKQLVQSRQDGQDKYDIKATPSFIIDGKTHSGLSTIEEFDKILKPLLPDA